MCPAENLLGRHKQMATVIPLKFKGSWRFMAFRICVRGISVAGRNMVQFPIPNLASLAERCIELCQYRFFFPPFNLCSSDDLSRNQSCFHAVTSAEAQPRSLKYHRVLMVAHILPESALFSVFWLCISKQPEWFHSLTGTCVCRGRFRARGMSFWPADYLQMISCREELLHSSPAPQMKLLRAGRPEIGREAISVWTWRLCFTVH